MKRGKDQSWKQVAIGPDVKMLDAMKLLETQLHKVCLVIDGDDHLLGTVTDGDIRRAILANKDMQTPVSQVMNEQPRTDRYDASEEHFIERMLKLEIRELPLLDETGRLVDVARIEDLLNPVREQASPVVLMAGGYGQRLRPLTENTPKPLLKVGDRPILETILEKFISQHFRRFYISVNYKASQIVDYFGDGAAWGAHIQYLEEDAELGTAGALRLIKERFDEPLVVMNGDLLTKVNFGNLLTYHNDHQNAATMCVREYSFEVPYGVVQLAENTVTRIDEKPVQKFFVNAGIYAIDQELVDLIPPGVKFDMPSLLERAIEAGHQTGAFPLHEYWRDVGHLDEYQRANREFKQEFTE